MNAHPGDGLIIVLENDRIRAEIDPHRAVLTRLEIRRSTGRARGDVAINRSDHPGARWRLWCGVDGTRHTVLTTFNTAGGQGIDRRDDAVSINTRFGREPSQLLPVHLRVSYTLDERGIWMHAKLSSDVEVRLEQLEYILFFHFKGDAQRTKGRAFFAPGWSDEFTDLEPQRKKCPRNSSSKYFYSAPWLDRRAMGWSWKGKGIWMIFPNACATRGRFQKDIGVFYHFDPRGRGADFNTHYITLQVEVADACAKQLTEKPS